MPAINLSNDIEADTEIVAAEHQQNYTELEAFINGSLLHADGYKGMNTGINLVQGADATAPLGSVTKQQMDGAFASFEAGGGGAPIGSVFLYVGSVEPTGYAFMNGQQVSKSLNPNLYTLCGTTFGPETATLFTLPNVEGRTPLGVSGSYARAATGGSANAVNVDHNHGFTVSGNTNTDGTHVHDEGGYSNTANAGFLYRQGAGADGWETLNGSGTITKSYTYPQVQAAGSAHKHGISISGTTGNRGESGTGKNLPPYLALHFIVKLG